jgi:hypothetical protein
MALVIANAPLAAQENPQPGIVTEQLAPLVAPAPVEGQGLVDRSERFKVVPFRGATLTVAPELLPPVDTVEAQGARIRHLDKMTGRTQTVEIATGGEAMVDRLRIKLDTCRAPADNAQHGTMAFLEIWDTKHGVGAPDFSGWMLAESPALSALDHPRYDVWVISCTMAAGAAPAASE